MNAITKKTPIEELIANVLETRFENFDYATVEHAKNRMIDVLGCLIGGANTPENLALIELIKDWGGRRKLPYLFMVEKP